MAQILRTGCFDRQQSNPPTRGLNCMAILFLTVCEEMKLILFFVQIIRFHVRGYFEKD
jgi:hypothetical protein